MSEVAHSHIGASSMHRWSECPGSVKLSEGIPNRSSKYAEEGTEAHELAAKRLITAGYSPDADPEMVEAVDVYVKAVEADRPENGEILVEHRFDLSSVHPGLFGTCDAIVFDQPKKLLRVFDYKHGQGIPVEVERNVQLMYYGLGALLSTNFPCDEVELVIVQPRCSHPNGPIRRWRFPTLELLDFAADLKKFALATENANAELKPGDHCRFCPASPICPELVNRAQAAARLEFSAPSLTAEPEKLSAILEWLPVFETWIESVRSHAYAEALAGRTPPGFKLVAKRATRKWALPVDKIETELRKLFISTREFYHPPELKSPPQVEKALPKVEQAKLIPLIAQISSGNTLVPKSDPRPEIQTIDAKTEFAEIELLS